MGVNVVEGVLKIGTPLCIPVKDKLRIGVVQSMRINEKPITEARAKDGDVGVKIVNDGKIVFDRHFDASHQIVSLINSDSCDVLNEYFKDDITDEDRQTIRNLKKILKFR